jgi:tRNA(adenine34) deaminase
MKSAKDEQFMRGAIEQAQLGLRTPGGAHVGCVITKDDVIVGRGFNEVEGRFDPTAHSEVVAIRRLCAELKVTSLEGYTLYCTLQPCGMCTMACIWAGISRIVYGATRNDVNSIYFASRHVDTEEHIWNAYRDDIEVVSGVLADECSKLYLKKDEPAPNHPDPAHAPTVTAS